MAGNPGVFFARIKKPGQQTRHLVSADRAALARALTKSHLPSGVKAKFLEIPIKGHDGSGVATIKSIESNAGEIFEIDDVAAADLIQSFDLRFGNDGVATTAIEGA